MAGGKNKEPPLIIIIIVTITLKHVELFGWRRGNMQLLLIH